MIAEFAMNDGTQAACKGDGSGSVPARASFERLIRKLQVGAAGRCASCDQGALAVKSSLMVVPVCTKHFCCGNAQLLSTPLHLQFGWLVASGDRSCSHRWPCPAGAAQPAGGDCDGCLQLCARRGGLLPQGERIAGARQALQAGRCLVCCLTVFAPFY